MYFVLVEGGKTKTLSVVIDEWGHILGYDIGGSSGWTTVGFERAFNNLLESVVKSIKNSSLMESDIDLVILGLPDLDTEDAKMYFFNRFKYDFSIKNDPVVVPDFITAYYATTLGDPGIAVIAGTGSIAYGRNSKGLSARAGGWGWFGGDEGSALWIAMKAVSAAGKAYDGRGSNTLICNKLLNFFKINDPLQLINAVYAKAREDIGELGQIAKLVDEAAEEGDIIAREILIEGGKELALMAKAVYDKIHIRGDVFTIGGVGSVYSSRTLKESFIRYTREFLRETIIIEPVTHYLPVKGLVALLAEKLHLSRKIIENVEKNIIEIKSEIKLKKQK